MTKKIFGAAAVMGLLFTAASASAEGDITVMTMNSANVYSTAVVSANTGGNLITSLAVATGGNGGAASVEDFGLAEAGNGGDADATAEGGTITTGDAIAQSVIANDVNSTDVTIEAENCGCKAIIESHEMGSAWSHDSDWWWHWGSENESSSEWDNSFYSETPVPQGDTSVVTMNDASVNSAAVVSTNTGYNAIAAGADAWAGNGGDAAVDGGFLFPFWDEYEYGYGYGYGEAVGGNAGDADAEAMGGTVLTGDAAGLSSIGAVVNDTVVRITKN